MARPTREISVPARTPAERHAAACQARMAERIRDARARAEAYEATLDPRQRADLQG